MYVFTVPLRLETLIAWSKLLKQNSTKVTSSFIESYLNEYEGKAIKGILVEMANRKLAPLGFLGIVSNVVNMRIKASAQCFRSIRKREEPHRTEVV